MRNSAFGLTSAASGAVPDHSSRPAPLPAHCTLSFATPRCADLLRSPAMDQRLLRLAWLSVLGLIIAAPALGYLASPSTEGMWDRLCVLTGLLALSSLVCAAVLPSRLRSLNRALGIESVIDLHRFLGVIGGTLVLAHLACVVAED